MFWEKIALFILIVFAIIGTMFVSIVIHEYTHYNDFKDFDIRYIGIQNRGYSGTSMKKLKKYSFIARIPNKI